MFEDRSSEDNARRFEHIVNKCGDLVERRIVTRVGGMGRHTIDLEEELVGSQPLPVLLHPVWHIV